MPELRKDPVVGRWVIISTERSRRPTNFQPVHLERSSGFCPFCPGNEDKTPPEVLAYRQNGSGPNSPGWDVRVVPNKFPALQIEGTLDRRGEGLYDKMNGVGAHEVVIESPRHEEDLADSDDIVLALISHILHRQGYIVDVAGSAEEAESHLAANMPDVALLDSKLRGGGADCGKSSGW